MKSSRKIEVSKALLVSLKAELSRKQDEVNKARVQGACIHPVPRPKKQTVWTKKNARVTERNEKDLEQQKEDEDILKKSRAVLEAKTKLYEKLSRKSTDNENFLVNFQQKITEEQEVGDKYDSPSDPEEDWMDYVDCLGRTRKCLKEDLAYVKAKDSVLSKSLGNIEQNLEDEKDEKDMEPELLSANLQQEKMRQKWEQQEEILRNKSDVHYQDVLFDEARSHGVGYYSFSQDETVRKVQQESLDKMRQETQKIQEATQNAKERRKQQMEARLKAARRRKRERMGLPPEEEEEEEEKPEVKEEQEKEEDSNKVEEQKPELKLGTTKPPKIRPWDIGKEGVVEPMSQEEWIKKKRIERPEEFAPPLSYQPDFIPVPGLQVKPKQLFLFSKKPSVIQENEDNYEIPLQLRDPFTQMPSSSIGMQDHEETCDEEIDISPPGDFDYHRQQSESMIETDENVRGKGTEIPPPPTFDYFRPSFKTMRKNMSNTHDLESAIDAGLKLLRQQTEEKENTREKGLLGII